MRGVVALLVLGCSLFAPYRAMGAEATSMDRVRVYIHYHRPGDRELVRSITGVLESMDYRVLDERLVTQPSAGDVRFFHEPDRSPATHVKAIVENVLAGHGRAGSLGLLDRRGRFPDAGPGLVEVWIPPGR